MDADVRGVSVEEADGDKLLVDGRARLMAVLARAQTDADGPAGSVQLKNGDTNGEVYYEINAYGYDSDPENAYTSNALVEIGGHGILFEDGIYVDFESSCWCDKLVLIYQGPEPE